MPIKGSPRTSPKDIEKTVTGGNPASLITNMRTLGNGMSRIPNNIITPPPTLFSVSDVSELTNIVILLVLGFGRSTVFCSEYNPKALSYTLRYLLYHCTHP